MSNRRTLFGKDINEINKDLTRVARNLTKKVFCHGCAKFVEEKYTRTIRRGKVLASVCRACEVAASERRRRTLCS